MVNKRGLIAVTTEIPLSSKTLKYQCRNQHSGSSTQTGIERVVLLTGFIDTGTESAQLEMFSLQNEGMYDVLPTKYYSVVFYYLCSCLF